MTWFNPLVPGAALAATASIGYTARTLLFWLWPEAAANFMSALFHGIDFRKLVIAPWAFGMGTIFGWIFDRFGHD